MSTGDALSFSLAYGAGDYHRIVNEVIADRTEFVNRIVDRVTQ